MPKPNHPSGKGPAKPKAAAAEPIIPENYVDFAEQLMKENCALITKTKIQNLLRLACDVYNNENRRTEERLLKESVNQIKLLRIRLAYECGRDPFTGLPIVPGSSLKGKLRTLLARRSCVNGETLPDFSADGEVLLRMFGGSEPVRFARLQFADAFLLNYDQLKGVGVTEVKSENTINRLTSKANPRQIERIVAGARFGVNIVYNLSDPKEMEEDLSLLSKAMKLLQLDYLGGHGSRGNGRVSFQNFQVIPYPETLNVDLDGIRQTFKTEVEEYELFSAKAGV